MDIQKHIKEHNMAKKNKSKQWSEEITSTVKSASKEIPAALRKQVIRAHWHLVEEVIAGGAKMEDIMKLPNGTREMVRRAYA